MQVLVSGALPYPPLLAISSFVYGRHSFTISFSLKRNQALYLFGSKFSVISFLEFLTYSIDSIFIGRYLGSDKLGIYNRATLLVNLPTQSMTTSMSKVLFPSFSRIQSNFAKLKEAFGSAIVILGIALFPVCLGISVAAREIVTVVLGPQWIESIAILQVFAIAVPFHLMLHFDGLILDATANLNIKLVTRIIHLAVLAILYMALSGLGLIGFAAAMVIGESSFYLVYSYLVARILQMKAPEMMELHLPIIAVGTCVMICIYVTSTVLRLTALPAWLILVLQIMVGAATLVVCIAVKPPQQLKTQLERRILAGDITLDRFGIMRRLFGVT
jgi:lipopolysaccharide exporter